MQSKFILAAIALAVIASGCTIQPVPEDVTGASTYDIARQVRCEAREAIVNAVASWLTLSTKVSDKSKAIGIRLKSRDLPLSEFSPSMLQPKEQEILDLFWGTGIAYDYVLEAEEKNGLNAEANLFRMFTGNAGTLGVKGGLDRSRLNTRTFTLTDTFGKLVRETPPRYCDDTHIVQENYIYPMAGKIGVSKVLSDFVHLTLFANLGPPGEAKQPDGPPTYVVALDFETTITGSVSPKIEFSPVRSVTDASFAGSASRRDLHKLTLGLAIAKKDQKKVGEIRLGFFAGPFLTARPTTQSEADATTAVAQYKATTIFNRRPIVISQ